MNGVSHIIGGVTAAAVLGIHSPAPLAIVVVASLLPDIDRSNSLLGRFIPLLPSLLEKVPGKRTVTHSLLLGAGLWFIIQAMSPGWALAFAVGYGSHLLLDLFTGYVALLWPLPIKFGVPLFGIPPIAIEVAAIACWGAWVATGGYLLFLNMLHA
ncbi:Inner membrane protein YdjM [compost metagenome]